jgi:hypothetical protein
MYIQIKPELIIAYFEEPFKLSHLFSILNVKNRNRKENTKDE